MKVLHIVWGLQAGGIETMLVNIANEQVKIPNIKVYILIINNIVDESLINMLDKRIKVLQLKRKLKSKSPWPIFRLNCIVYRLRPDVIHLHEGRMIKYLLPMFRRYCCTTKHNSLHNENPIELKSFKKVVAISYSVQKQLSDIGINSICIPNGIEVEKFKCKSSNIINGTFKIVQVGRLYIEQKAQDLLIEAINKCIKEYHLPLTLDLIGEGDDRQTIEQQISMLDLNEKVRLMGLRSQEWLYEHLKDYDLFVQPSYFEGFGLTVVEAMAAKVPVLVSENQGPLEIIDRGKYGFTFINGSMDSCSEKIMEIYKKGNLTLLADNAYKHAVKQYSVRRTALKYLEEYKTLL